MILCDKLKKIVDAIKNAKPAVLIPVWSLVILLAVFSVHFSSSGSAAAFFSEGFVYKSVFNYLFILGVNCLLFSVSGRFSVSAVLTAVISMFFTVSVNLTYVITGKPLLPSDILLAGEVGEITSFVDVRLGFAEIAVIVILFLLIVGTFVLFGLKKAGMGWVSRLVTGGISLVYLVVFIWIFGFCSSFISGCLPKMGIQVTDNPGDDYMKNGALLTFVPRMNTLSAPYITEYDRDYILKLKAGYSENPSFEKTGDVQPSIITIQNEAWWDPTLVPGAEFKSDPMATYRSDMKNLRSGYMVSPVYGGGTCIPEFEYLTGFSSVFLPDNCYPYIQAVTRETPSVASVLKKGGYQTTAIHTYNTTFYGRKKAYPLLGFDKFIGSDDMKDPEYSGFYISDRQMGKEIISAYENKTSDKVFIYGLTMQNHGDYTKERYIWHDVPVTSDKIGEKDLKGFNDYVQGVYEADRMFRELTEYFSKVEEPVMIIMYGDHLPLLGTEGSTYVDGGFVETEGGFDYTQHEQLFKTTYSVWANYPIDSYHIPEETSAVGLSLLTLKAANLDSVPWHFKLIDEFNKLYPVYTPHVKKDTEKTVSSVSEEDRRLEENYRYMQHDMLYGNRYSEE